MFEGEKKNGLNGIDVINEYAINLRYCRVLSLLTNY